VIVVSFDPVAGEVIIRGEGEKPLSTFQADRMIAKHYASDGILYLDLCGQAAELYFCDPEGRPGTVDFTPAGDGRWRVTAGGLTGG